MPSLAVTMPAKGQNPLIFSFISLNQGQNINFISHHSFKPDHHFLKLASFLLFLGQTQQGVSRAGEEEGEDVESGGGGGILLVIVCRVGG